jgi:hypothetical protein
LLQPEATHETSLSEILLSSHRFPLSCLLDTPIVPEGSQWLIISIRIRTRLPVLLLDYKGQPSLY